jgi:cytochrome c-type biogenesis protein CcmE
MKKLSILLGVVVVIFGIVLATSFKSELCPYVSVSYVVSKGRVMNVQVNGTIVPNSTKILSNNTMIFNLSDGKTQMRVVYHGILSHYQEGIPAVVVGSYYNRVFHAKEVLMKCPSKYRVLEENASTKKVLGGKA